MDINLLRQTIFSNSPLHRENNHRKDPSYLLGAFNNPTSLFLPFFQLDPLTSTQQGVKRPLWLKLEQVKSFLPENNEKREGVRERATLIFLGSSNEINYFAFDISDAAPLLHFGSFSSVRGLLATLNSEDAALIGHGRAMLDWHLRHQFCGTCGSTTIVTEGGAKRVCLNKPTEDNKSTTTVEATIKKPCGMSHYPRTDPVVIMLVLSSDRTSCLLGRKDSYPKGWYTCLSGFMEPGESIEEACRRETREESGVEIGEVTYFASQPWPFLGGQVMIGCFGVALSTPEAHKVSVDKNEMEDIQWSNREEAWKAIIKYDPSLPPLSSTSSPSSTTTLVSESPTLKDFQVPGPWAIAHTLIKTWVYFPSSVMGIA